MSDTHFTNRECRLRPCRGAHVLSQSGGWSRRTEDSGPAWTTLVDFQNKSGEGERRKEGRKAGRREREICRNGKIIWREVELDL